MTEQTTPITMRVSDSMVDELKMRARRYSFERNKDITYVDLIREAVEKTYSVDLPNLEMVDAAIMELDIKDVSDVDSFWTDEIEDRLKSSKIGHTIQSCIDSGDYSKYAVCASEIINEFVVNRSLGVLLSKTRGKDGKCILKRDVASVARVTPRRGAKPEEIAEGDEIWVPPFEIACNSGVKNKDLSVTTVFLNTIKAGYAIQCELNSNIINMLDATCGTFGEKHGKNQIVRTKMLSFDALLEACRMITQHGLIPSSLLVHPDVYIEMRMSNMVFGPSLKVALETRNYGVFDGLSIHISNRVSRNDIFVLATPGSVGVMYYPKQPIVEFSNQPEKLRKGFVSSINVGLCVACDYSVAKVEYNRPKMLVRNFEVPEV